LIEFNPVTAPKLRVCAVSYLNTVPLVWGMMHGSERGVFDLSFALPSECADRIATGDADIGAVPVIEVMRQRLAIVPGTGIACRRAVRTILLASKKPPGEIRTLAADIGSRTSVMLARVILSLRYGAHPEIVAMAPDLESMLTRSDAALIIGDAALRLDPRALPYHVLDLGEEWVETTGLPMVFAVWAGRPDRVDARLEAAFTSSCRFGLANLDTIISQEAPKRGVSEKLVRQYLTENLVFELGERDYEGMRRFLGYAEHLEPALMGARA
jgi:predicted solute-binding protein